jgi:hypothetical protein
MDAAAGRSGLRSRPERFEEIDWGKETCSARQPDMKSHIYPLSE